MDISKLESLFKESITPVDFASIRFFGMDQDYIELKKSKILPPKTSIDRGVMLTVSHKGGMGYGATSDLSLGGIKRAFGTALEWAEISADRLVAQLADAPEKLAQGSYQSAVSRAFASVSLEEKLDRLAKVSEPLSAGTHAADWVASLWSQRVDSLYVSTVGSRISQKFEILTPQMSVTAQKDGAFQTRTFGGYAFCGQGGLEHLDRFGFDDAARVIQEESEELLFADNCPTGEMDLLLAPDQMILQIHESIGHPLELDRILGDERNYAGTSFVTKDMFGDYKYGSDLLNIIFDPKEPYEMASYGFDDEGLLAEPKHIIEKGVLKRGLGGLRSQHRIGIEGVACSRAVSWNRPPIDRMANLNLVPGTTDFDQLISQIDKGVYMKTNASWSIDDSRNKFQFGCEYGQMIENGKLTKVVKHPSYRGVSANFWRNLKAVGDGSTRLVMGTPFCGKGEPNQAIGVGHASPACLFSDIQVFGGEA